MDLSAHWSLAKHFIGSQSLQLVHQIYRSWSSIFRLISSLYLSPHYHFDRSITVSPHLYELVNTQAGMGKLQLWMIELYFLTEINQAAYTYCQ